MGKKWFGSINNRIMEGSAMPEPVVGMPATFTLYTDRNGGVVTEVRSPSTIVVAEVKVLEWAGDHSGYAKTLGTDPIPGTERVVTKRRDGGWKVKGGTDGVVLGKADTYRDPSF